MLWFGEYSQKNPLLKYTQSDRSMYLTKNIRNNLFLQIFW